MPGHQTPPCQTKPEQRRSGQAKTEDWFRAAGAIEVVRGGAGAGGLSTHAYGGTRMGDNPETNVVDKWGMSHEVPNLGVLGRIGLWATAARVIRR